MLKQTLYLIGLVIILAVVGSLGVAVFQNLKTPAKAPAAATSSPPVQKGEVSGTPPDAIKDITVTSPRPNALVSSPLTVSGRAIGTWYFEASFPVIITDGDGLIIGETPARALGNWMTTSSVPFTATLTFQTPKTGNGFLILKNDNPSGNPATQRSVEIPIRFGGGGGLNLTLPSLK